MPSLIACLSTGKGTWTEVTKVIQSQAWTNIFLITTSFGQENFTTRPPNTTLVLIDTFLDASQIKEQIKKELTNKISDFEVALNLASGSGKEHMAILEAVMELGLNFRLVTLTNNNQIDIMGLKI